MNKNERNLEISFGVLLIILAIFLLITGWYGASELFELREKYIATYQTDMGLTYTAIFKSFHLFF